MSEQDKKDTVQPVEEDQSVSEAKEASAEAVDVKALLGWKKGMTAIYDSNGVYVPVTVVSYESSVVTQVKTKEKEGYNALQIGTEAKKRSYFNKAELGHLRSEESKLVSWLKEFPATDEQVAQVQVGTPVAFDVKQGDEIRITGTSKGRGFSGVMKRWGFGGGRASHGSKSHRRPGSIGNCTEPSRVFAGKKMPGRFGAAQFTLKSSVVGVLPEENALLIKGAIPGHINGRVVLRKV